MRTNEEIAKKYAELQANSCKEILEKEKDKNPKMMTTVEKQNNIYLLAQQHAYENILSILNTGGLPDTPNQPAVGDKYF